MLLDHRNVCRQANAFSVMDVKKMTALQQHGKLSISRCFYVVSRRQIWSAIDMHMFSSEVITSQTSLTVTVVVANAIN